MFAFVQIARNRKAANAGFKVDVKSNFERKTRAPQSLKNDSVLVPQSSIILQTCALLPNSFFQDSESKIPLSGFQLFFLVAQLPCSLPVWLLLNLGFHPISNGLTCLLAHFEPQGYLLPLCSPPAPEYTYSGPAESVANQRLPSHTLFLVPDLGLQTEL